MATGYATERGELVKTTGHLYVEKCCSCGVVFAMPTELRSHRLKDKAWFYCPNGHGQSYTRNEEDRLRAQLESEHRALTATQDRLNAERASHAATKGQLTKVRNRVMAGVCPDCNRTFKQLERHMRSRHKGPEEAAKLAVEMQELR